MANPIKKFGYVGKGRKAMLLLKQDILTKILLRRTKVQCADVLSLPPRSDPCPSDALRAAVSHTFPVANDAEQGTPSE